MWWLYKQYKEYREREEGKIQDSLDNDEISEEESQELYDSLMDWGDFQDGYADANRRE